MKSSCVQQPNNNRYIQVNEWQIAFCRQNHCAAFLLSHFIAWHDWKLNHDEYYLKANNIAELHGDGRPNNQNAYLFFTMEDLAEGILNLYGKNAINTALLLLEELQVISVHKNPNPRYHFDKTKYFMFYPEICNKWIKNNHKREENQNSSIESLKGDIDRLKVSDRSSESNAPSIENKRPSLKKGGPITDTTSNTTSTNKVVVFLDEREKEVQEILDALVSEGFPEQKLQLPESVFAIHELYKAGACVSTFVGGYHNALSATETNEFSVNYLLKAVESLMKTNNKLGNQVTEFCESKNTTTPVSTTPERLTNKKQQQAPEEIYLSEPKSPIRDDFYPDEETIKKAIGLGLNDATNPEKISQFISYNQSNGSLWSDYNPLFIRWLMLDVRHNQRVLESAAQKPFRRDTDASYSNKARNAKYTLADVIAANRDAVSPDGERLFPDFEIIEAEYGMALDSNVTDIRPDIY